MKNNYILTRFPPVIVAPIIAANDDGTVMKTFGILLAAGASRRFGTQDKLLAGWRGAPLVSHPARALAQAGCDALAAVVSSPAVARALPPSFLIRPIAADQPMSASFAAAWSLAAELGAERLLIVLGDMPGISAGTLQRLQALAGARGGSCACSHAGTRMPPALIRRGDLEALNLAPGDHGARALIATLPEDALLPLDEAEARDVDRPADIPAG